LHDPSLLHTLSRFHYLTSQLSVSSFVSVQAWGRTSGGSDAGIRFLSDSNAELTRALGLAKESPMMPRTTRFSLVAEDGVVTQYFSSAEESSNTWAPAVLSKL
jgi:peroxiredoxin